jgi:hypothetical protein
VQWVKTERPERVITRAKNEQILIRITFAVWYAVTHYYFSNKYFNG